MLDVVCINFSFQPVFAESTYNGGEVTLTAAGTNADGDTLTYSWFVDDAQQSGEAAASFLFSMAPDEAKTYTVKVVVSDGTDEADATAQITVSAPLRFKYYDTADSAWKELDIASPPADTLMVLYMPTSIRLLAWTSENALFVYDETGKSWSDTGMELPDDITQVSCMLESAGDGTGTRTTANQVNCREITFSDGTWKLGEIAFAGAEDILAPATTVEFQYSYNGKLTVMY